MRTLLVLVAARGIGAVTTVGLALFVARTFGIHFSGTFYFLISTAAVLGILTRLGTEEYLTAHVTPTVHSGRSATAPLLVAVLAAISVTSVGTGLTLLAASAIAPDISARLLGGLSSPMHLLGAVVGINVVWTLAAYCRAIGWATTSILVETALLSGWLGGLLVYCAWRSLSPSIDTVAIAIASLAPALIVPMLVVLRRQLRSGLRPCEVAKALRGLVRFASVTMTNSIIAWIPLQVLGLFGRIGDVAVYNAAFRMAMLIGAFGIMVKSSVIRAHIDSDARGGGSSRREDLRRSTAITMGFVLVSMIIAWQDDLLAAAFGDGFERIGSILLVMLLAQSVNIGGYLIETKLVLTRGTRILALNALMTFVTAAVSAPVLVAAYGLQGAAWSFALTILVSRLHLLVSYLRGREGAIGAQRT